MEGYAVKNPSVSIPTLPDFPTNEQIEALLKGHIRNGHKEILRLQSMKNFEIFREMIFHMSRLRTNIMLLW
jgi:hypothetical protein